MMRLRIALSIVVLGLVTVFSGLVLVAARGPYPEDRPPATGLCPTCGAKLLIEIYDGVGQENLTEEFRGYASRHCDLLVPFRSLWLFPGWRCSRCPRTWPMPPSLLEQKKIPKPTATERALSQVGLWPSSTRWSRAAAYAGAAAFSFLAAWSLLPRLRRSGALGTQDPNASAGARVQAAVVAVLTAVPLVSFIIVVADPISHPTPWPRSGWEFAERIELSGLAVVLALFAARRTEEAGADVGRGIALGTVGGLAAAAAQFSGILIAGLATEYLFSTRSHQELIFPTLLTLYALALVWTRPRMLQDRHKGVLAWTGVALCALAAWAGVKWVLPG